MSLIPAHRFEQFSPGGYYVACRMGFVVPEEQVNSFPADWIKTYTERGYVIHDPILRWAFKNTGIVRWNSVAQSDDRQIVDQASAFGMKYGVIASYRNDEHDAYRTIGSFSRNDREFSGEEITLIYRKLIALHENTIPLDTITDAELEVLRLLKNGYMVKQIAAELGISVSAIKGRLRNVKQKLNANTNIHAAARATDLGLI